MLPAGSGAGCCSGHQSQPGCTPCLWGLAPICALTLLQRRPPTPSALGRCRAPAHNKGPGPCFSHVALNHHTCMPTSKSSVGYCHGNCAPPVFAGWGLYPRTMPTPPGLMFAVHPKAHPGAWHQAMPSAGAWWHRAGFEAADAGSKFTLSVLRQL